MNRAFGIIVPPGGGRGLDSALEAARLLREEWHCEAYCEAAAQELLRLPALKEGPRPDCLLSFGGDGTMLHAAQLALRWDVPLAGVNHGTLGFLADIPAERMPELLSRVVSGDYGLERRPMLAADLADGRVRYALNDVSLHRGGHPRLVMLTLAVNGEEAVSYRADGVVVATATGSTGYALSAGGPLVMPGTACCMVTPVCAHSLTSRPIVLPLSAELSLTLADDAAMAVTVQVDGQHCALLHARQTVNIRASGRHVSLIRMTPQRFFDAVRAKLT